MKFITWSKVRKRILKVWRLKHLELQPSYRSGIDNIAVGARLAQCRNDLIDRLNACKCEACGNKSGPFAVHHLRKLKDLRHKPLYGLETFGTATKNHRSMPNVPCRCACRKTENTYGEPCALKGARTVRRAGAGMSSKEAFHAYPTNPERGSVSLGGMSLVP